MGQKCLDNVGMDITFLRETLNDRRGQWTRIADAAGLSRKTIQRIVDDPTYNPTLATVNALTSALIVARIAEPKVA